MSIDTIPRQSLRSSRTEPGRVFAYESATHDVQDLLDHANYSTAATDFQQHKRVLWRLRRQAEQATIPPNGTFFPLGEPLQGIQQGIERALIGVRSKQVEATHQSLRLLHDTLLQHADHNELLEELPKTIGNLLRFFNLAVKRGILHAPFSIPLVHSQDLNICVDCQGDHSDLRIETSQSPFDSITISQQSPLSLDGNPTQLTHLLKNISIPHSTWKNLKLDLHQLSPYLPSHAFLFDLVETLSGCGFDVSQIIVPDLLPQRQTEFGRLLRTGRINNWSVGDQQLTLDIWPATLYPQVQDICYRGQDLAAANEYCAYARWEETQSTSWNSDEEEKRLLFTVDNQLYLYRVASQPKPLGKASRYVIDINSEAGTVARQLLVDSDLAPTLQRSS